CSKSSTTTAGAMMMVVVVVVLPRPNLATTKCFSAVGGRGGDGYGLGLQV
nr:hypothetical protein [Tanacetum cinerariifolium]